MADSTAAFAKMVPGFDFLESLVKNAGAALPSVGQWIAPTLDPDQLDKRIEELRTVQFWLEQNARMLGATIQALEVQRMTLSTLKTMNLSVGELRESMMLRMPEAASPPASAPEETLRKAARKTAPPVRGDKSAGAAPAGVVDPMQWWGALTQQFTQLAATAMRDSAAGATRGLADPMAWPPADAAGQTSKQAAATPATQSKASVVQQAVGGEAIARKPPAPKRRRARP
jgi:hypothetical protein